MSSSDRDTQLASWLPKLESYRLAIGGASLGGASVSPTDPPVIDSPAKSIDSEPSTELDAAIERIPEVVAEEIADTTKQTDETHIVGFPKLFSTSDAPKDEYENETEIQRQKPAARVPGLLTIHIPIDGILHRLNKYKSFVLGIGSIGSVNDLLVRSVVADTVARCSSKTSRKTILVTVRPPDSDVSNSERTDLTQVHWTYFGETKVDTKAWKSQLSNLPIWKKEFGLIVFDLGDVRFPTMPRIGKLCDGVVLQMLEPSNSREAILALKSLQKDRLKILGAWSVEQSLRKLSA